MYTKISLNDFEVLVRLPVDFSDENEYPIFIVISGGNQSVETVMYSANVYFNTSYFQNYIQIIPINNNDRNFKDYSADEIDGFINAIMNYFPCTISNWVVAGSSNGGRAIFNIVAHKPKLFQYVVAFPGGLFANIPNENWSHLSVVLANGKKDSSSWLLEAKTSYDKLAPIVKHIELMVISGQKHIFSENYDINEVYSKLFLATKND